MGDVVAVVFEAPGGVDDLLDRVEMEGLERERWGSPGRTCKVAIVTSVGASHERRMSAKMA